MDNQLWKQIPDELLQLILQFDGSLKKRNGVYMNQIPVNDERFPLLRSIPKKEFFDTTLNSKRASINSEKFFRETFVFFRHKRDEKNHYFTIYFKERLKPSPYKITQYFSKHFFADVSSFTLP